jgi:hypothetical protein
MHVARVCSHASGRNCFARGSGEARSRNARPVATTDPASMMIDRLISREGHLT